MSKIAIAKNILVSKNINGSAGMSLKQPRTHAHIPALLLIEDPALFFHREQALHEFCASRRRSHRGVVSAPRTLFFFVAPAQVLAHLGERELGAGGGEVLSEREGFGGH